MVSKPHLVGGDVFEPHPMFISPLYEAQKRLFVVCLFADLCGIRSHMRESVGVHDIHYKSKSYKLKLLGK